MIPRLLPYAIIRQFVSNHQNKERYRGLGCGTRADWRNEWTEWCKRHGIMEIPGKRVTEQHYHQRTSFYKWFRIIEDCKLSSHTFIYSHRQSITYNGWQLFFTVHKCINLHMTDAFSHMCPLAWCSNYAWMTATLHLGMSLKVSPRACYHLWMKIKFFVLMHRTALCSIKPLLLLTCSCHPLFAKFLLPDRKSIII
jgi:hypothetical protein